MKHWIGIDVSSKTLDFALLDELGTHLESAQVGNDRKAVMKLMAAWRKRHAVEIEQSLMRLEPTGHYTLMMLNLVVEQQWPTWLAHPRDIQQSMGIKRVKNDKVDALRIAQYARTFRERARMFTAQNLKLDKLKHLLTRRQHLVRVRAMYKKHISDAEPVYGSGHQESIQPTGQALDRCIGSRGASCGTTDHGTGQGR